MSVIIPKIITATLSAMANENENNEKKVNDQIQLKTNEWMKNEKCEDYECIAYNVIERNEMNLVLWNFNMIIANAIFSLPLFHKFTSNITAVHNECVINEKKTLDSLTERQCQMKIRHTNAVFVSSGY